jgi:hypothetical protein
MSALKFIIGKHCRFASVNFIVLYLQAHNECYLFSFRVYIHTASIWYWFAIALEHSFTETIRYLLQS